MNVFEIFNIVLYYPLLNVLTFFIQSTPGHYAAVGIILVTLLVRFILIVPSRKAAQAQRKIAQVAPLLEDLKKEYANDKQGLATAQMDLYKKNNINPFGSCGLALVQLPVLLLLFRAIRDGLVPNNPHLYSWLPHAHTINNNFFGINMLNVDHTYILPVLAAALQFVQVKLTTPKPKPIVPGEAPDPAAMMQRNTMYLFPLLTLYIARKFPAGLALYWVITTIFTIVQQYYVNKEKFNIAGVEKVLEKADKAHPEYHRSKKAEEEIMEETSNKKGVSITVRRKK